MRDVYKVNTVGTRQATVSAEAGLVRNSPPDAARPFTGVTPKPPIHERTARRPPSGAAVALLEAGLVPTKANQP
jgi:hypothetical protein